MTREEAIQVLNMVEAYGVADTLKRMPIEALSAPTDGDLISRQDAIDALEKAKERYFDRVVVIARMQDILRDIPSAQPTIEDRETGHWEITDAYPHNVYCSECHKKFAQTHWEVWEDGSLPRNYCPNCGSKMEVEQI